MRIKYKNKEYEANYDAETNIVGVKNPDNEILDLLINERIQRGLLLGYFLNNPYYNLDEVLKNELL